MVFKKISKHLPEADLPTSAGALSAPSQPTEMADTEGDDPDADEALMAELEATIEKEIAELRLGSKSGQPEGPPAAASAQQQAQGPAAPTQVAPRPAQVPAAGQPVPAQVPAGQPGQAAQQPLQVPAAAPRSIFSKAPAPGQPLIVGPIAPTPHTMSWPTAPMEAATDPPARISCSSFAISANASGSATCATNAARSSCSSFATKWLSQLCNQCQRNRSSSEKLLQLLCNQRQRKWLSQARNRRMQPTQQQPAQQPEVPAASSQAQPAAQQVQMQPTQLPEALAAPLQSVPVQVPTAAQASTPQDLAQVIDQTALRTAAANPPAQAVPQVATSTTHRKESMSFLRAAGHPNLAFDSEYVCICSYI